MVERRKGSQKGGNVREEKMITKRRKMDQREKGGSGKKLKASKLVHSHLQMCTLGLVL